MPCLHVQRTTGPSSYRLTQPLSDFLLRSSECSECGLLLRVIENCKPDWVDEQKVGERVIGITKFGRGPSTIELFVGQPQYHEKYEIPSTRLDSFQLLRHALGMRFLL
jgi:hypothetical protein